MTLLLTLIARLILIGIAADVRRRRGIRNSGTGSSKTIPGCGDEDMETTSDRNDVPRHMIGTSATITFDGWKSRSVQRPSRGWCTRGKTIRTSRVRTRACNMAEATAILEGIEVVRETVGKITRRKILT